MRLYPDMQNKNLVKVEVRDQETWEKLKNCEEEIGKIAHWVAIQCTTLLNEDILKGQANLLKKLSCLMNRKKESGVKE